MRTYHPPRPLALVAALLTSLAVLSVAVASPAVADLATPQMPVALHPDGHAPYEQYLRSPVTFSAQAADGDQTPDFGGQLEYVVQHLAGGRWSAAARTVTAGPARIDLTDGGARWRVRWRAADGTLGPWSSWIRFTVDSRIPATPSASIPDAPVTVGVPVPVTLRSPDGAAAMFYLSDDGAYPPSTGGQDPCGIEGFVCLPRNRTNVTVPWTFLRTGFPTLSVFAFGRGGTVSGHPAQVDPGLVTADDAALTDATRWVVPTEGGGPATIGAVGGGPALRIGPTLEPASQQITSGASTVVVPSAEIGSDTSMRATAVVDTSSTFSVGAVVQTPADSHDDLTVLNSAGPTGSAFSLVLTSLDVWRFCVTTVVGDTGCSTQAVDPFDASVAVVGRYDAVRQAVSVAVGTHEAQPITIFPRSSARAASSTLRFGGPAVRGSVNYAGPIGSPLVASGWISGRQVHALLAGPA